MPSSLNGTGVSFSDGSSQDIARNWNVTYVSVAVANGGVYTLPARCIGVFVWCGVYGGNNTGSINRVIVRDASNNVLNTIQVNRMTGGDGAVAGIDNPIVIDPKPTILDMFKDMQRQIDELKSQLKGK